MSAMGGVGAGAPITTPASTAAGTPTAAAAPTSASAPVVKPPVSDAELAAVLLQLVTALQALVQALQGMAAIGGGGPGQLPPGTPGQFEPTQHPHIEPPGKGFPGQGLPVQQGFPGQGVAVQQTFPGQVGGVHSQVYQQSDPKPAQFHYPTETTAPPRPKDPVAQVAPVKVIQTETTAPPRPGTTQSTTVQVPRVPTETTGPPRPAQGGGGANGPAPAAPRAEGPLPPGLF